jgi:hypothetical protein
VLSLLMRVFGENGPHYTKFEKGVPREWWEESFEALKAILAAAKEDYEGGYLFTIRGLVTAEVLSDAIDQAEALLAAGYKDPACVVAGVALEQAIKELAKRTNVDLAKLDKMNADLAKAGVYNMAMQKQVTAWAHLRNKSAHGEWGEYTDADVQAMIPGVQRFLADYL